MLGRDITLPLRFRALVILHNHSTRNAGFGSPISFMTVIDCIADSGWTSVGVRGRSQAGAHLVRGLSRLISEDHYLCAFGLHSTSTVFSLAPGMWASARPFQCESSDRFQVLTLEACHWFCAFMFAGRILASFSADINNVFLFAHLNDLLVWIYTHTCEAFGPHL